ncbi:hypothetical protein U9M48_016628 [Paspalum notatum var. saurae]
MTSKNPAKTLPRLAALLLLLAVLELCAPPASSQPLHSEPMATQSTAPPSPPPPQPKIPRVQVGGAARLRRIVLGVLFGSLSGFLLALGFLYAIRVVILHAKSTPAIVKGPVSFTPQISPRNLLAALPSAQPLAHGPHGKYYKLDLDNDLTVAVKRLEAASRPEASPSMSPATSKSDMRRVQRQLQALARVRHQNVMTLKAYVREPDRLSLVYDLVPGGSLEDVMKRVRSQQVSLNWDARSRIAAGIAKGLRHLHFECNPRILHCNLKPSNVMLDEGFEPILADCGVARLIAAGSGDPELCSGLYAAPECYQSSRYTDKSDVYALGMILAMLLTGRDPTDPFFSGETGRGGLPRWIRHMQQSADPKEALDSSILGEEREEEEMLMALRVAIVCLSDSPADRPSSDELVAMLMQLPSL